VASLSEPAREKNEKQPLRCLACGKPIEQPLSLTGSLRCLECRETNATLDPHQVDAWRRRGAHF
jgi:hypothetical protein